MDELSNLLLAKMPVAVVDARSCTQVTAFLPFTALPNACKGKRFAVVEVLGEKAPEPGLAASGAALEGPGLSAYADVASDSGTDSTSPESDPPFALRGG